MKYVSGRLRKLELGLSSYSETKQSLNVIGNADITGIASASAFADFDYLQAPYGSTVSFTVTVASKSNHRHTGGSGNAYYINGIESPVLTLTPGRTYRFNNNNSGSHPLRFYYDADRTIQYTAGVNFQNTYTEITISDTTPNVLHYQCVNHALMGNSVVTNSNVVDSPYAATLRKGLNVTSGVSTFAGNIDANGNINANGNIIGDNATNISGINSVTATSFFGDGSGLVNLGIPGISTSGTTEFTHLEISGNLKVAGVSTFNNVKLDDNNKIQIGSSQDLELYHNGTASYIDNNTGALYLRNNVDDDDGGNIIIQAKSGKTSAVFQDDEGVRLYYDDAEKIATTGYGVTINGTTETQELHVTGISTFGDDKVIVGGATTDLLVNGSARVTGEFKVGDGTITLNSAGLSTFPTGVDVSGGSGLIASSAKITDLTSGRVVFAGTGGELEDSANLTFNGTVLSGTFTGDGTGLSVAIPGISTSGTTELTNLVVSGLTTLATAKVTDLTDNRIVIAGTGGELEDTSKLTFDGTTLAIVGDATFTGNVSVAGTLTSEDKTNIDSLGIVTARTGVRISSGGLVVTSGVSTFTDAIDSNGGANISGGAGLVASTAKISDLTSGRVVYAGASGELQDSSNLTFNGTTLTGTFGGDGTALLVTIPGISTSTTSEFTNLSVVGVLTAGSAILGSARVTDLTQGRVVFVGASGELQDNSSLTFNGSTVTAPAFAGDGSALTGITAGGVGAIGGLTVKDEGVVVGTAGSIATLDFLGGTVAVTATSGASGIATVTISTEQNQNIQTLNVSGVTTFNSPNNFIGNIVAYNPIYAQNQIYANGNIIGDNATNISGINSVTATTLTGTLQTAAQPNVTSLGTLTSLNVSGAIASGGNITIENTSPKLFLTDSDNNSDFSVRNSDGSFIIYDETNAQNRLVLASDGTFDFNGNVDLNNGLDVTSGTTNLSAGLNVTGVSTFNDNVQLGDSDVFGLGSAGFNGGVPDLRFFHNGSSSNIINTTGNFFISQTHATDGLYIKGPLIVLRDTNNNDIIRGTASGVTINPTSGGVTLKHNGNQTKLETTTHGVVATGVVTATSFEGDGSNLTGITAGATLSAASGSQRLVLTSLTSGTMTSAATDADLSFNATENLLTAGRLSITGITTFNDDVTFKGATSGRNITFDQTNNRMIFDDNAHLILGSAGHLIMYHNGSNGYFTNYTGNVNFDSPATKQFNFNRTVSSAENFEILNDTGKIKLGTSSDLQLYHDGFNSYVKGGTTSLRIQSSQVQIQNHDGTVALANFTAGGTVQLMHGGTRILETASTGILVDTDSSYTRIQLNSQANTVGELRFLSDNLILYPPSGGSAQLNHGSSKKLETTTHGVVATGVVTATSFVGDGSLLTNLPSGGGGGDKFNTTITNSVQATVYGYETDIISFPSDNTKRYVIESISVGNVTTGVGTTVNVIASINPGVTTYSSENKVYLAYNTPVPDNGLVELIKQPMVMNPSDVLKIWATDINNHGINGAIELYATYTAHDSTDYIAGYGSTTNVTTTGIATVYTSASYPTVIQSIKVTNRTDSGDFPITIQIGHGSTVTHLAKNLVVPRYASVELLDRPKRIETGAAIRMQQAAAANTIDVIVSGKKITS